MGSALTPSVRPREEYLASAGMYHLWAGEATSPDCRLTPCRPGRPPDRRRASRRHERAYSPPWDIVGACQPRQRLLLPARVPTPSRTRIGGNPPIASHPPNPRSDAFEHSAHTGMPPCARSDRSVTSPCRSSMRYQPECSRNTGPLTACWLRSHPSVTAYADLVLAKVAGRRLVHNSSSANSLHCRLPRGVAVHAAGKQCLIWDGRHGNGFLHTYLFRMAILHREG